ncbi:DUF2079 domain-containing protein [Ferroplasma sp.]|uniref:DUF2079 domain-containing protein n=1 Tax=Ferroplasma sp. TaxID=2591003 RepID=UPI00260EA69F|nr:DUF2079 domain-containing protein [Ferroplasma sp.]
MNRKIQSIIIIIAFILNSILYSYLSVMKYFSFNANVFDLGLSSEAIYNVFHGGLIATVANPKPILMNKLIYLLIAPFYYLYPHQYVLLIFQSTWLSFGIIPLYLIASNFLSKNNSILFSLSYLFYYPLYGAYFFDFHFMALFPTFFLISIYFLFKNKYKTSILFIFLSAITDLLAPVIIGLFSLAYLLMHYKKLNKIKKEYFITVFSISLIIFIIANLYYGSNVTTRYTYTNITPVLSIYKDSLPAKILFIFRITFPLLFLSFFGFEWFLLVIPFYLLFSISGNSFYGDTLLYQYPSLYASGIFLSALFGIKNLKNMKYIKKLNLKKVNIKKVLSIILILNIVLAIFFTPAGSLVVNQDSDTGIREMISGNNIYYNEPNCINYNINDKYLNDMIKLIPLHSSILIQNNMPQLTQKYNWQLPADANNPEYIITDPYSPAFNVPQISNKTMVNIFNSYYKSGNYGIYAEINSMILLKKNYNNSPVEFIPVKYSMHSNSYELGLDSFMAPGNYSINVSFNNNYTGNLTLSFTNGTEYKYYMDSKSDYNMNITVNEYVHGFIVFINKDNNIGSVNVQQVKP